MKVRIKKYLSKEEKTNKPSTRYKSILLEDGQAQGQMNEVLTIGEGYFSEEEAIQASILYKNEILNEEPKDIEI